MQVKKIQFQQKQEVDTGASTAIISLPTLDPVLKIRWQSVSYRQPWRDVEEGTRKATKEEIGTMRRVIASMFSSAMPKYLPIVDENNEITYLHRRRMRGLDQDDESDEDDDESDLEEQEPETYSELKESVTAILIQKIGKKQYKRYRKECKHLVKVAKNQHRAYQSHRILKRMAR